jgi:uncharacterized membrane protein
VAKPATERSFGQWLTSHWFAVFLIGYGSWVWLPWLAPVLMHAGQVEAGHALYFIYSLFCHQLPERSYFLFGSKTMFSLAEIQGAWQHSINPFVLRRFIGSEAMGWKVAWSDRMISFYTSIWAFAAVWSLARRKIKPLPWWAFALFLLPLVLDGSTHALSDLAGIGQGFRDSNQWLAGLTNHGLPASYYAGDLLGSFNSWMRLVTGVLAGLGIVWFAFPYVEDSFAQN